jgi:hypothetical protein
VARNSLRAPVRVVAVRYFLVVLPGFTFTHLDPGDEPFNLSRRQCVGGSRMGLQPLLPGPLPIGDLPGQASWQEAGVVQVVLHGHEIVAVQLSVGHLEPAPGPVVRPRHRISPLARSVTRGTLVCLTTQVRNVLGTDGSG